MATIALAFALSINQSRKTDINIIMASSPLHHANPTRRPIPSVDIPHCLRVSYNSGVIHYRDTNTVILWLQHDDEEDRKIPRRRHRDNTQLHKTEPMTSHACSLAWSSRRVLNSALPSGAIQSIKPPFPVLSSVFYTIRPHPFRTRDRRNPSSTSCDKHFFFFLLVFPPKIISPLCIFNLHIIIFVHLLPCFFQT